MRSPLRRTVADPLEAALVGLFLAVMRVLPLDIASAIGGFVGRSVGPRIKTSRIARRNLQSALPELDDAAIERVVRQVWDNLGRTVCELPHLQQIAAQRVTVMGIEHARTLAGDDEPGILFSGHFANWEVFAAVSRHVDLPLRLVYRAPNNPLVDRLLAFVRRNIAEKLHAKGSRGARDIMTSLKEGAHLGMLVDQKMNDGIAVPFFGRDAMTAPALAQLALRFNCPVLPARLRRINGARFELTVEPPFRIQPTGDRMADIRITTERLNGYLERWIRDDPGQWLWLHRRWPN